MKRKFVPTIIVVLLFALFNAFTYEDNAAADGVTQFGFPFRFYVYNGGKFGDISLRPDTTFFPWYLVADVFVLIALVIMGNYIAKKWRQTK